MSASCCGNHGKPDETGAIRATDHSVLWFVLAINAAMFAIEIGAGLMAGSASLQADALDFLGDAGNYAISLFVVGMALRYRAMATFAKGATMGLFGLWVIGIAAWNAAQGTLPGAFTIGHSGDDRLLAQRCIIRIAAGPIGAVTPTCDRPGFARVTMCWAISLS